MKSTRVSVMFFKNKNISKEKKVKHITEKSYKKLTETKKLEVLLNMKNRGKLRHVLAVHVSHVPFESFAKSNDNLLELGSKFFEVSPEETLIKED